MRIQRVILAGVGLLALVACDHQEAIAVEASSASAPTANGAAEAAAALAALDAIAPNEWLTTSSAVLLDRVIKASSKESLDEAAKTDARAQALVGSGYYFGRSGYPQSNADAAKYYRQGAASNPIAQINLGNMLKDGSAAQDGMPAPGAAVDYFRMAAAQGHPVAELNLAVCYRDGTGVSQDYKEAARWFDAAAKQGLAQAQYELGRLYGYGEGVAEDFDEEERLYKAAADQGYADALYAVADQAETKNLFDSLSASERAAQPYMDEYSDLENASEPTDEEIAAADEAAKERDELEKFDATPLYQKALKAYQRDAAAGSAYALRRIGDMYYNGKGVPKDVDAAYANYKKGADQGDWGALLDVGLMTERGEGVAKDEAAAANIYKWLAEREYAGGELELGRMTDAGLGGIAQNHDEAMRLCKRAARHGNPQAQEYLKKIGETW